MKPAKSKLTAIIVVIAILAVAAGTAAVINHKPAKSGSAVKTSSSAQPAVTAGSPSAVVKKIGDYNGKTIAVKGIIVQIKGASDYYLTGQEQHPSAIKLDFSKSGLSPEDYSNTPPANSSDKFRSKGPYTVTGTVDAGKPGKPAVLVIQSIK